MTLLVANIGTSDIAVRPQSSDYFFPIGFDRREPNLQQPEPDGPIAAAWQRRQNILAEQLCHELGITVQYNSQTQEPEFFFREFTDKLNQAYSADPHAWHDRIRPGRLWGVIKTAIQDFQVQRVHIFVTDQEKPHPQDTIHGFQILDRWFKHQYQSSETPLTFHAEVLPKELAANDEDSLLEYYYSFFSKISRELNRKGREHSSLLISVRGGTPQMQTALRIQSMTAMVNFQATLTPQLSVENMLQGHPSSCQAGGYWKYTKSQKYQTITTLLQRWDFDGAIGILEDWQRILKNLVNKNLADPELKTGSKEVQKLIDALRVGLNGLNLDYESMYKMASKSGLDELVHPVAKRFTCDKLLNLYTHCKLYSKLQLNQSANFLTRLSSFYEETQLQMLIVLQAERFFEGEFEENLEDLAKWKLDTQKLKNFDRENTWAKLNKKMCSGQYSNPWKSHNFDRNPIFQINSRPDKTKLLKVLFESLGTCEQIQQAQTVLDLLGKLDYWASIRNTLIHQAEGLGFHRFERQREKDLKPNSGKTALAQKACSMQEILPTMAHVCRSPLNLVHPKLQEQYLQPASQDFYIYGQVRHWVEIQIDS